MLTYVTLFYNFVELTLTDEELQHLTHIEIEKHMQVNNRSLRQFKCLPYPEGYVTPFLGNRLIYEERNYDPVEKDLIYQQLSASMTGNYTQPNILNHTSSYLFKLIFLTIIITLFCLDEQRDIFEQIMEAVNNQKGGVFFLSGYGGTGKTFMWNTLSAALRSKRKILLNAASSGIASLLLPGGRTAHSKFKIPIPILESSICTIDKGKDLADLLKLTQLIIWDEAPMAHKFCFEALDKFLKDIMSNNDVPSTKIFGGNLVVILGKSFLSYLEGLDLI
jgi:ATP-dependent DNA helicase PIF1